MLVKEIMTPNVKLINPDLTLKDAANQMRTQNIGALPVGEDDRLVGMLTDRDIAIRAVAEGKNPEEVTVRDVMTTDIIYCFEEDDVQEAAKLMREKKVRRLNVLNSDKRLVGICSLGDLAVEQEDQELSGDVLEDVSKAE